MRNMRVLVVEDAPDTRKAVCEVLKSKLGIDTVMEAENGRQALEMLEKERIDLVLSDWDMPEVSGEELLYRIRESGRWARLPFILLTEHGERDFIVTAIQLGVSDYIVKPFTATELADKVKKAWNAASKRQAERYFGLPEHRLVVKVGEKSYPGRIVNISRTGVLLKLEYVDEIRLFHEYEMALEVANGDGEPWVLNPLVGVAVRMEAENIFHVNSRMCDLALYFWPTRMHPRVERVFQEFLHWLGTQTPEMIGNSGG